MNRNNAIKNQIMGKLMMRGETLKSFALRHGYKPNTVQKSLRRFARGGPSECRRQAFLSGRIMDRLIAETGVEVHPFVPLPWIFSAILLTSFMTSVSSTISIFPSATNCRPSTHTWRTSPGPAQYTRCDMGS